MVISLGQILGQLRSNHWNISIFSGNWNMQHQLFCGLLVDMVACFGWNTTHFWSVHRLPPNLFLLFCFILRILLITWCIHEICAMRKIIITLLFHMKTQTMCFPQINLECWKFSILVVVDQFWEVFGYWQDNMSLCTNAISPIVYIMLPTIVVQ